MRRRNYARRARRGMRGDAPSPSPASWRADDARTLAEITLQLVLQAPHADPEQRGRGGPVPPRLLERFEDVQLLHLPQAEPPWRRRQRHRRGLPDHGGKMLDVDEVRPREHDRPLDPVLELPHVPGPRVGHEALERARRQAADRLPVAGRLATKEVRDEQRNVFRALPEGRQLDVNDRDVVIEVPEKAAVVDGLAKVAARRGDDADLRLRPDHVEKPRLQMWRRLADDVGKGRAGPRPMGDGRRVHVAASLSPTWPTIPHIARSLLAVRGATDCCLVGTK